MKKIIIDTNALMAISDLKIDIFSEVDEACDFPYHLYVLEGTILELNKIIKEQRLRFKQAAKLALALLKAKKVKILSGKENVDDLLVEHSRQGDLILTQDLLLKKRLQKPYLTIRQKKMIILVK